MSSQHSPTNDVLPTFNFGCLCDYCTQHSHFPTILYGSETGNSEGVAKELATDFERREYSAHVQALDDIDVADLENMLAETKIRAIEK